jgi:hypothetical protein
LEIFEFKQGAGKTFGHGRRRATTSCVPCAAHRACAPTLLASAPRVTRGPADRGCRVPRRPRPYAPRGQPCACRLAVAPYRCRAPGRPLVRPARRRTCVGQNTAVPRQYLRRQHAITAERLFKVIARSCVCRAEPPNPCRAARHGRRRRRALVRAVLATKSFGRRS